MKVFRAYLFAISLQCIGIIITIIMTPLLWFQIHYDEFENFLEKGMMILSMESYDLFWFHAQHPTYKVELTW